MKKRRISDDLIYDTIMELVLVDTTKAIRPQDIASTLYPEDWQSLLKRVRLFGRKLAVDGYINIMRKGKVADPDDFKGVYKLQSAENAPTYIPRLNDED